MNNKIIIVDDSPTIRKLVGFILRKQGFIITEAENGIDALEKMVRDRFDLVISDLNMPKMDGMTLIYEIRQDEQYKDIPIVILTTEQGEQDKREGMSIGANLFLVKPTQPDVLLSCVKDLLAEKGSSND